MLSGSFWGYDNICTYIEGTKHIEHMIKAVFIENMETAFFHNSIYEIMNWKDEDEIL